MADVRVGIIDSDSYRRDYFESVALTCLGRPHVSAPATLTTPAGLGWTASTGRVLVVFHETDLTSGVYPANAEKTCREDVGKLGNGCECVLVRHTRYWDGYKRFEVSALDKLTEVQCGSDALQTNLGDFLTTWQRDNGTTLAAVELLRRRPVRDAALALACLCLGFLFVKAADGDREATGALGLDEAVLSSLASRLETGLEECRTKVMAREWWLPVSRDTGDRRDFEETLGRELGQSSCPDAVVALLDAVASDPEVCPSVGEVATAYESVRGVLRADG